MKIQIFQIKVNEGRRVIDPEAVQELANSISEVGLMSPITVDLDYTLIAGLRRLEAAKRLGWREIECTVSNIDGLLAEMAEIDENIIRRGFDQMEACEQLARRKEIYEIFHPETKKGISQAIGMNLAQGNNVSAPGALTSESFVSDTSKKTGAAKRTIEENLQLARDLTPKTKKIIRGTNEKIKKKDMLKLSRLPPQQQEEAASKLATKSISSLDSYRPETAKAVSKPSSQSGVSSTPTPGTGYYPTINDSVADLKNPDKERGPTPDSFLVSFTLFLQRFGQGVKSYEVNESTAVYSLLTQNHLAQIKQEISSVQRAIDHLFKTMERKSKNERTQKA